MSATRDRPATYIAPSILSCDFAQLASEAQKMKDLQADWLHVDVMDGHFVRNLTLGPPIVAALRKHTDMYLDCHLMVVDPAEWIDDFAKAGANGITFHYEAIEQLVLKAGGENPRDIESQIADVCHKIRNRGMNVGIALRPITPFSKIINVVKEGLVDLVLAMTVEPGFGGQKFMTDVMPKVREIRDAFPKLNIEVDGGLSPETIDEAAKAGANVIVAGSAIFGAKDPGQVIQVLRTSVDTAAATS